MSLLRYLDLFLAESREHLADAHQIRTRLLDRPTDPELWREFMRHAHSMKGMAATMGFRSMVKLTHAAEELADRLAGSAESEARRYLPMLGESLDCLGGILDRIEEGQDADCPRAEELGRALQDPEKADAPLPAELHTSGSFVDRPTVGTDSAATRWCIELDLKRRPSVSAEWTVSIIGRIASLGRVVESSPPSLALDGERSRGRLRLVLVSDRPPELLERELTDLIEGELTAVEEALAAAGAPWTPGGRVGTGR